MTTTKTPARTAAEALVHRIGELAFSCERYDNTTEEDLLDMDEMLNELVDSPCCNAKDAKWAHRMIHKIGKRLAAGDWDA